MSSSKNPYNKQVTPTDKLHLSQGERTSIMKLLAYNIKDMKKLKTNPDVIQYLKACNSVGTGYVQQYLSKLEESKKLKARLSVVDNDIQVHKTAASDLLAASHENYQCPVLDDDEAFVSPCDNMNYEEIDKVIEMGKVPSIKASVVMPANVTPKKTDDLTVEKQVTSAMLLNHAECKDSQVDVVVGDDQLFVSPCDNMDSEEIDKVIENGKVSSINAIVVMPATVTPKKRKHVAHTPSMDNDSSEIITRAKGLVGSRAKSILESGKKNDE